jgi:hypothetical protein
MAIAKQPLPTAIRMMSSMLVLPKTVRSDDAECAQRHDDGNGKGQVNGQYNADLECDLAEARTLEDRLAGRWFKAAIRPTVHMVRTQRESKTLHHLL